MCRVLVSGRGRLCFGQPAPFHNKTEEALGNQGRDRRQSSTHVARGGSTCLGVGFSCAPRGSGRVADGQEVGASSIIKAPEGGLGYYTTVVCWRGEEEGWGRCRGVLGETKDTP
jgi:hypothetical protein